MGKIIFAIIFVICITLICLVHELKEILEDKYFWEDSDKKDDEYNKSQDIYYENNNKEK